MVAIPVEPGLVPRPAVPQYWVLDLAARRVVVHTDPLPGDGTAATATYGTVRHPPLDTELDLLGLTLRLSDLLAWPGRRTGGVPRVARGPTGHPSGALWRTYNL